MVGSQSLEHGKNDPILYRAERENPWKQRVSSLSLSLLSLFSRPLSSPSFLPSLARASSSRVVARLNLPLHASESDPCSRGLSKIAGLIVLVKLWQDRSL